MSKPVAKFAKRVNDKPKQPDLNVARVLHLSPRSHVDTVTPSPLSYAQQVSSTPR